MPGTRGFLIVLSLDQVDEGRELRVSTGAGCQLAVARPYGLSVAAHLRDGKIDLRVFGDPASFWRDDIPKHEASLALARGTHRRNRETLHEWSRRPNFERPTTVWNNGSRASSSLQTI